MTIRSFWALIRLVSFRQLTTKKVRLALTALGISIGVALYTSIQVMTDSTADSFKNSVSSLMGEASLSVLGAKTGFPEASLETVEAVPGVKFAIPVVENFAYFKSALGIESNVMVLGLDLLKEGSARAYKTTDGSDLLEDPLIFLNQADSIIVTEVFAKQNALELDSPFELRTSLGPKTFVVRGILKSEGVAKAFGGSIAIMDIDGARMTFGKEAKFDRIDIIRDAGIENESLQARLTEKLGPSFRVLPPEGQSAALTQVTKAFTELLNLMGLLSLVVSLFLVYNTMSITLAEREPEIATLRTLGTTKGSILRLFLIEGLIIGFSSSLIGTLAGLRMGKSMLGWVSTSMEAQFLTPVNIQEISLRPATLFQALVLGTLVTVLAVWIPARRASKLEPIKVLKKTKDLEAEDRGWLLVAMRLGPLFLIALGILSQIKFEHIGFRVFECVIFVIGSVLTATLLFRQTLVFLRSLIFRIPKLAWTGLSIDGLLRTPNVTWMNSISLSVSFLMVGSFAAVSQSFTGSLIGWFEKTMVSEVSLSQGANLISVQVQPFSEELVSYVNAVPEVFTEGGRGGFALRISETQFRNQSVKIKAWDEPTENLSYRAFDIQTPGDSNRIGRSLFEGSNTLVSDNFAMHFKVKVGDKITLDAPLGPLTLTVVGIVTDYISPVGSLYLSRQLYAKFWQDSLVTAIFTTPSPGVSPQQLADALTKQVGRFGLVPTLNNELLAQARVNIKNGFAPMKAIEIVAVVVAFLGLINTLFIRVFSRVREFGVLRSVGMSRGQLTGLLLLESGLQCTLIAFYTMAISALFGQIWMMNSLSQILGWFIRPHIPFDYLFLNTLLAMFLGVFAALLPLQRIKSLSIKEAMGHD